MGDATGYATSEVSGRFSQSWYCELSAYPILTDLTAANDAATVALGEGYRMPTKAELRELNTLAKTVTEVNGIAGMRFSANNGNSIFIPFAGYAGGGNVHYQGSNAIVWSSSYKEISYEWSLVCNSNGNARVDYDYRCCGASIRPICEK